MEDQPSIEALFQTRLEKIALMFMLSDVEICQLSCLVEKVHLLGSGKEEEIEPRFFDDQSMSDIASDSLLREV